MPEHSIDFLIDQGIKAQTDGNFTVAEQAYAEALALDPNHPDALHLLGVLHHQTNRPERAIKLLTSAVSLDPEAPLFHYNLAEALRTSMDFPAAIEHYQRALQLDPSLTSASLPLAESLIAAGRIEAAIGHLGASPATTVKDMLRISRAADALQLHDLAIENAQRAVELEPDDSDALAILAKLRAAARQFAQAADLYARAYALAPTAQTAVGLASALGEDRQYVAACAAADEGLRRFPHAINLHFIKGYCSTKLNQPENAEIAYRTLLESDPDHLNARVNLAVILRNTGQPESALREFQLAHSKHPSSLEVLINLAVTYKALDRLELALEFGLRALELAPNDEATLNFMALLHHHRRQSDLAIPLLEHCRLIHPEGPDAYANLGLIYLDRGQLALARAAFEDCVRIDPSKAAIDSNLLLLSTYDETLTPAQVFEKHMHWAGRHQPAMPRTLALRDPTGRKIRVAYLSPDFRQHVVAFFSGGLLTYHDRSAFEIFCYSDVPNPDSVTRIFQSLGHTWRTIVGRSDDRVLEMLDMDRIDILVDLAGHTSLNRLPLFARRAAPVQVSMIGYPNTTGLTAMDYQITDVYLHPPERTESFATETLIHFPDTFATYTASSDVPPVAPLPASTAPHITFGSFNNLAKLRPTVLRVWGQIALRLPNARFVIQASTLKDLACVDLLKEACLEAGLPLHAVDIQPPTGLADFMRNLSSIDIALDPFPFNGHTTSCQLLHMGVPIITLAGQSRSGRMGVSLLSNLNLPELIARSPEEYVDIAVRLASDLPRLSALRASLRHRMESSPIMNARLYTRRVEAAFRQMLAR